MDRKTISYRVDPLKISRPLPPQIAEKFKTLRLEALHYSPQAYLSTFEREENFTESQWEANILDPSHHYLICRTSLRTADDTQFNSGSAPIEWTENDTWVGMVLLSGPYEKKDYGATPLLSSASLGPDEEETRWHITGLYVQPDRRSDESAIAFHEAILDYLTFWTDEHLETVFDHATGLEKPKRARLAGLMRTKNAELETLYEALAGKEVGWADRSLGCKIAGIEEQPEDSPTAELRMRVLERVIEC